MHIPPVAQSHPAGAASQTARVSPAQVSAAVLQRADGDGDGKTGAAALNDGDAAAQAAAKQARGASGGNLHPCPEAWRTPRSGRRYCADSAEPGSMDQRVRAGSGLVAV